MCACAAFVYFSPTTVLSKGEIVTSKFVLLVVQRLLKAWLTLAAQLVPVFLRLIVILFPVFRPLFDA